MKAINKHLFFCSLHDGLLGGHVEGVLGAENFPFPPTYGNEIENPSFKILEMRVKKP